MRQYTDLSHLRNEKGLIESCCKACNKIIESKDLSKKIVNGKPVRYKKQFCNHTCQGAYNAKKRTCKTCKKSFKRKGIASTNYCSDKCKINKPRKKGTETSCTFCGVGFCNVGYYHRKTCSDKCHRRKSTYQVDKRYWEELDAYRGFCTVCDKELKFKQTQSLQQRKNQKTCSPECASFATTIATYPELKNLLQEDFYKKIYKQIKGKSSRMICKLRKRKKYILAQESNIDDAHLLKIFPKDYKCPIYGHIMNFNKNGCTDYTTATLDRIDSTKGYVKGNVEWLSMEANRHKRDMTFADVEKFYLRMKKHEDQTRDKKL